MVDEPVIPRTKPPAVNPYQGRWRWWYSAIADWMIRNPGGLMKDCAAELGKAESTISFITNTDLFRDYFAKRRAEYQRDHDFTIAHKLTEVAELALDATIEKLKKQRDKVDLPLLTDLMGSSLDRLGFAPKQGPTVQIINETNNTVQLPNSVTAEALEEARMAMRQVEATYQRLPAGGGVGKGVEPPGEVARLPGPSHEEEVVGAHSSTDS